MRTMNFWQATALQDLSQYGLTQELLLSWKPPVKNGQSSEEFDLEHKQALSTLILIRQLSPQDAIQILHEKTGSQADAIATLLQDNPSLSVGEAVAETTGLTFWMLASLKKLYSHGLRRVHLLSWKPPVKNGQPSEKFDCDHWKALSALIVVNRFRPIEEAIVVISGTEHNVAVNTAENAILTIQRDKPIAKARQYARIFGSVMRTHSGSLATLPFDTFNLIVQIATGFLHTSQSQNFFTKPLLTQSLFCSASKKNTQDNEKVVKKRKLLKPCHCLLM